MADFVRLVRGYRFAETTQGTTGQEQFLRNDGAPGAIAEAALPTIGTTPIDDPDGSPASNVIARSKTTTYADGDINTALVQFDYATVDITVGTGAGDAINVDPDTRNFQLGVERVSLQNPSATWQWNEITGNPAVNQPISKVTLMGEFTIPKGPLTQVQSDTFLGVVKATAGRINSDTTWDSGVGNRFAVGQCLFMGITGGSARDTDGDLFYQYNMHFAFRVINDVDVDNSSIASNDWQYLLSQSDVASIKKGWARPETKDGGKFLYETATFGSLT